MFHVLDGAPVAIGVLLSASGVLAVLVAQVDQVSVTVLDDGSAGLELVDDHCDQVALSSAGLVEVVEQDVELLV